MPELKKPLPSFVHSHVNDESEARWLEGCRRGRSEAFEPLVRRYQAEALAMAEALLLDADEAADAVQDAFVRAYRGIGRLAAGDPFGPWFRTILRNRCLDRLRSAAYRRHESLNGENPPATASIPPVGTERIEREALSRMVHAALRTLSPAHREALVLKEMEGLSYAQMAEALGVPAGTVASRIFHAREALRQALLATGVAAAEQVP